MYCSSFPRVLFNTCRNNTIQQTRSNFFLPKVCGFGDKFQTGVLTIYSTFMRNVSPNTIALHNNCNSIVLSRASLLRYIKRGVQKFPLSLKEQSVHIVRVCTQQCECVLAHRIRRGQQIFSLYSKLWDEVALKELLKKMRHQFSKRGKEFLMGAAGVSLYNWDKERITDEEVFGHLNELEAVYQLRDYTITCPQCHKRMVIDTTVPSIEYCKCSGNKSHCPERSMCGWKPFLEREDLLVWRKEDEVFHGLYVYKVYGRYHEVAAEDFLKVQIDTEFRKMWDNTAISLKVVEQDNKSNSDIVYWEMEWPRMFSNRDYVFNRRYLVDREKNVIVVINKGTEHPNVPENPQNHRVKDYWSFMVIKSYSSINEPGMEFSLTYFDNPGVSLPSSITAWVAMTEDFPETDVIVIVKGLPDFQCRLRQAARDYRKYKDQKDLIKPHCEGSRSKLRSDPGSETYGKTEPKSEAEWHPSKDHFGGFNIKPNTPSKPSCDQPSPVQEYHPTNSPTSRMYLKQRHAWQLFI